MGILNLSVLILGAAAVTSQTVAPAPSASFADIPNVTMQYYDVAGRDPRAIRRSIDAVRPTDPNDAKRVDAVSKWHLNWRWRRDAQGACSARPEDLTFTATVTLPRLADPDVPPHVRERFDRFIASLLVHEEGHVRYAWEHRGDIVAAINAAGCDGAAAAAQQAVRTIGAHDVAYDKATNHGGRTIVPFG